MPLASSVRPTVFRNVLNNLFSTADLSTIVGAGKIALVTAGPSPITPATVFGDFTEALFGGYAQANWTPTGAPVNTPSGNGIANLKNGLFVCDGTTPETITGYVCLDSTGVIVQSEYFPAPIPMALDGDFIDLACFFVLNFSNTI